MIFYSTCHQTDQPSLLSQDLTLLRSNANKIRTATTTSFIHMRVHCYSFHSLSLSLSLSIRCWYHKYIQKSPQKKINIVCHSFLTHYTHYAIYILCKYYIILLCLYPLLSLSFFRIQCSSSFSKILKNDYEIK